MQNLLQQMRQFSSSQGMNPLAAMMAQQQQQQQQQGAAPGANGMVQRQLYMGGIPSDCDGKPVGSKSFRPPTITFLRMVSPKICVSKDRVTTSSKH